MHRIYPKYVKRVLDIFCSLLGFVVLLIPMLVIALLIKCSSKGPVFFCQERVGIHNTRFRLLKFRTMRTDAPHDMPTHLLQNPEQYITKIGKFLRKTSLDELPQLLNILSGKMSIIGPRPALWNQADLIAAREESGVNDVKPGLTGWAQVNGRDELEIVDKVRLDVEYAQHISLKMDWTCLWMTVGIVLKSKGVIEGGTGMVAKELKKQRQQLSGAEASDEDALPVAAEAVRN